MRISVSSSFLLSLFVSFSLCFHFHEMAISSLGTCTLKCNASLGKTKGMEQAPLDDWIGLIGCSLQGRGFDLDLIMFVHESFTTP